jgi:hypothetical protein
MMIESLDVLKGNNSTFHELGTGTVAPRIRVEQLGLRVGQHRRVVGVHACIIMLDADCSPNAQGIPATSNIPPDACVLE